MGGVCPTLLEDGEPLQLPLGTRDVGKRGGMVGAAWSCGDAPQHRLTSKCVLPLAPPWGHPETWQEDDAHPTGNGVPCPECTGKEMGSWDSLDMGDMVGCRGGGSCGMLCRDSPSCGSRFDDIDLPSAVKYLIASDPNLQVLGAAYLQHKCYSDSSAKKQVSLQKGGRRDFPSGSRGFPSPSDTAGRCRGRREPWERSMSDPPGLSPRPAACRPCPSW